MKIINILICILAISVSAEGKRISEYTALETLADTDALLLSDTSDSGREKKIEIGTLATYLLTDKKFVAGDLSDLQVDVGSTDENIVTATPVDKDLQTYTAAQIDTLLLSAGTAPTIQSADPTAASANGWYLATGTGDAFFISDDGMFTIAGVYSAWDTSPTAFTFTDETDVALNTAKVSDTKTVSGIDRASTISVTGDTGFGYKKNGSACTAAAGTVVSGDEFNACVTSSGVNSTATTATVAIGGVTDVYSVTTLAEETSDVLFHWGANNSYVSDKPSGGSAITGASSGYNTEFSSSVYKVGSHSIARTGDNGGVSFATTSAVVNKDSGQIGFWYRWTGETYTTSYAAVYLSVDANNFLKIRKNSSGDGKFALGWSGDGNYVEGGAINNALTVDTWYYVVAKWNVGGSPTLYLGVYNDSGSLVSSVSSATALTAMASTPTSILFGDSPQGVADLEFFDNIVISDGVTLDLVPLRNDTGY